MLFVWQILKFLMCGANCESSMTGGTYLTSGASTKIKTVENRKLIGCKKAMAQKKAHEAVINQQEIY